MRYTLSPLFTFLLLLLVPQSQAVIPADPTTQNDESFIGYSCQLAGAQSRIRIDYSQTNNGLPCEVNLIGSNGAPQFLLQARRHLSACAMKAENMSLRLIDRGWSCQSSAL